MVDNQLRTSGIIDWRILDAMNRVPRERFVPEARKALAYIDEPVTLTPQRRMLSPASLGRLIQLAEVESSDIVLDIGCGTGYSTAVLSMLASAVVGLDDDADLVETANDILGALDIGNAAVLAGPLDQGVAKEAPFDVIIIEGAVDAVPPALLGQLRDGGRLVAVIGQGNAADAHLFVKSGREVTSRLAFNVSLPVVLKGREAPAFVF